MEHEFWRGKWDSGRIGFHQREVNPYLQAYRHRLTGERVLVPLSGKSHDITYLVEQRFDVVAVEFVEAALEQFATESGLSLERSAGPLGLEWRGDKLRAIATDIFKVGPDVVGTFDHVFDRAALIALPPDRLAEYVELLDTLLKPGGTILLTTLDYDETQMSGPPFSVPPARVKQLFEGFEVTALEEGEPRSLPPKPGSESLKMQERAWLIGKPDK